MIVQEKPFNNPNARGDITGVFEILIPNELWALVIKAQKKHPKLTFSWITRYVLFKMLLLDNFWKLKKFIRLMKQDKLYSKERDHCHRHLICLYNDDQKRLKIFSAELQIAISKLVRIGLLWFIEEFEADEIPDFDESEDEDKLFTNLSFEKIKEYGTKFVKNLEIVRMQNSYFSAWTVYHTTIFATDELW